MFDNKQQIKSRYVHYRDLFKVITYPETYQINLDDLNINKEIKEVIYLKAYECFEESVKY